MNMIKNYFKLKALSMQLKIYKLKFKLGLYSYFSEFIKENDEYIKAFLNALNDIGSSSPEDLKEQFSEKLAKFTQENSQKE